MSTRRKNSPATTAIVRVESATPAARLRERLDPFAVFLASCTPDSRPTMRARLHAAARILSPGSSADSFDWSKLDHTMVVAVMAVMAEAKASPSTRNLTRAALRKMAKTLFGLRLLSVDERQRIDDVPPARGSRLPRGRALANREIRKLFRACAKDAKAGGQRNAALLAVLFGGGLRRDEAAKLDLKDFDGSALRVRGKGGKERLQPLGEDAARAVAAWVAVRGDHAGPLFLTIDKFGRIGERRLRGTAIRWQVTELGARAALEKTSPHDLRRSFVTSLLEAGEDLATASKAAGHASVTTTSIYDRRGEKKVAEAVAKLNVPFEK